MWQRHKELILTALVLLAGLYIGDAMRTQHRQHQQTAQSTVINVWDCTEPAVVGVAALDTHGMSVIPEHTLLTTCTEGNLYVHVKARPF